MPDVDACAPLASYGKVSKTKRKTPDALEQCGSTVFGATSAAIFQMFDLSECLGMLPGQFCFIGCLAPYVGV